VLIVSRHAQQLLTQQDHPALCCFWNFNAELWVHLHENGKHRSDSHLANRNWKITIIITTRARKIVPNPTGETRRSLRTSEPIKHVVVVVVVVIVTTTTTTTTTTTITITIIECILEK